jgi:hypothetical protein
MDDTSNALVALMVSTFPSRRTNHYLWQTTNQRVADLAYVADLADFIQKACRPGIFTIII